MSVSLLETSDTSRMPKSRRCWRAIRVPSGSACRGVDHRFSLEHTIPLGLPAFRPQESLRWPAGKTIDTLCRL